MCYDPTFTTGDIIQAVATLLGILAAAFVAMITIRREALNRRANELLSFVESINPNGDAREQQLAWELYYKIIQGKFKPDDSFYDSEDSIRLDFFLHFFDTIARKRVLSGLQLEDLGILRFDILRFYVDKGVEKYINDVAERLYKASNVDTTRLRPFDAFQELGEDLRQAYLSL